MASRQRSLLVPEALGKLQKFSSTIQRRGTLKPHEDKRVAEGFSVLLRRPEENKTYHEFLSRVKDLCGHRGDAMVALCIVGLGKHAIKILKDEVQLDLPLEIAREKEGLWNTALDRIGRKYSDGSIPISDGYSFLLRSCTNSYGYFPTWKLGYVQISIRCITSSTSRFTGLC